MSKRQIYKLIYIKEKKKGKKKKKKKTAIAIIS